MAAASTAVAAGDVATATQYNNLRQDAVHASLSHVHDGSFGSPLTFASPVATGTANSAGTAATYVRSDHVHSASLGTAMGSAASDVSLTTLNAWYTVASTVVGAGTWFATASVAVNATSSEARISYSGTVNRLITILPGATADFHPLVDVGVLASAGTVLLEARRTGGSGGTAFAGSHLVVLKVG